VSRIRPVPKEQWDDACVAVVRAGATGSYVTRFLSDGPDSQRAPNGMTIFMNHPALGEAWLNYNAVVLRDPALPPRERELIVLRVAWLTRQPYEWVQHNRVAARLGLGPAEVEAVADGADAPVWTRLESALIRATDEMLDHYRIDDDTWAVLAEHLDERQLFEVAFTIGTYTCLSMAFNSFDLELDPELADVDAPPLPMPR
jgi:4-carboxymuconolactone decarboxylase